MILGNALGHERYLFLGVLVTILTQLHDTRISFTSLHKITQIIRRVLASCFVSTIFIFASEEKIQEMEKFKKN